MLKTNEIHDAITSFEKSFKGFRTDKEDRSIWKTGCIYQHGEYNQMFKVYLQGYALGRCVERLEHA